MGDESTNSSPHHSSAKGGCELTHLPSPFPGRQAGRPERQAPESPTSGRRKAQDSSWAVRPTYPQTRTVIELVRVVRFRPYSTANSSTT